MGRYRGRVVDWDRSPNREYGFTVDRKPPYQSTLRSKILTLATPGHMKAEDSRPPERIFK